MAAASSSAMNKVCYYCKSPTDEFYTGWRLRDGGFALLCQRCGAAYDDGTMCDTFHPEASGYRECETCKKKLHCGCIMSVHRYKLLIVGGVQCLECAENEALALQGCLPPLYIYPEVMLQETYPSKKQDSQKTITVGKNSDSCNHIAGSVKLGADPIPSPDPIVRGVSPNIIVTPTTTPAGAVRQAQSPSAKSKEESPVNLPDEKSGRKRRRDANKLSQVQARYLPEVNPEELQELCRQSKSSLVPLFTKDLTASDADPRNGRLVLPKRCAEAYFPNILEQGGDFIMLQEIGGKEWEVHYRYYSNSSGGKMYVLEGLKYCTLDMQWEAGDTVTFYKREEDGKLFIHFKKLKAPTPVLESST